MPAHLHDNPLRFLLASSAPEVRYLVLRDLLEESPGGVVLEEAYRGLAKSERILELKAVGNAGVMGDAAHFDILYRGTMWYFCEAAARGLDARDDTLAKSAEFLLQRSQLDSGGITLNWKPAREVSCRTGDLMRWMVRAGITDARIARGIGWIKKHQRHDGGWLHCPLAGVLDMASLIFLRRSGDGKRDREEDAGTRSCVRATASCLAALIEARNLEPGGDLEKSIARGAEYFLNHRFFMGPERFEEPVCCGLRGADYLKSGYPVMSHYDALMGLQLAARAGFASDPRTVPAFNHLVAGQEAGGTWPLEAYGAGMLFEKKSRAGTDGTGFITLNALLAMKYCGVIEWNRTGLV
ncbi:MAG: hypothetical protein EPN93_01780 [Spirochaetes bacterium]|nr:MAG: hypothetical protein EPN93_01780 [Spirochaetota bacterium]